MAAKKKKAAKAKTNGKASAKRKPDESILFNLKLSPTLAATLRRKAKAQTKGNMSQWVRLAIKGANVQGARAS